MLLLDEHLLQDWVPISIICRARGQRTNLRMPLDIFIPSHIKYVRDLSMKHFSDMADDAGIVVFPVYPSIPTELIDFDS